MKRREWGYNQLIETLEEHSDELSSGLKAAIKCIRMIAEKGDDDSANSINTNHRGCCSGYIGNDDNSSRAER